MSCGIYKITNKINNKVYIGKSIYIERRWYEHKTDMNDINKQNHLYNAMRKYGKDNFLFEIIELCPKDNNILTEREIYWINYYNSYEEGYNETRGGEGHFKFYPEEIIKLWDNGLSIYEITQQIGCEKQTVYDTLKDHPTFSTQISMERSAPRRSKLLSKAVSDRQSYPVYQYDLEGNFIAEYPNLTAAANAFGYPCDHSICKVINNQGTAKLAYNFQWSKEKVDKMPVYHSTTKIGVRNINTGKCFASIREAAKWANVDKEGIRRAIYGQQKFSGKHPETGEKLYWEIL